MSSKVMVRQSLLPSSLPTKALSPDTPSIMVLLAMGRLLITIFEKKWLPGPRARITRQRDGDASRDAAGPAAAVGPRNRPSQRRRVPVGADAHHGRRGGDRRVRRDRRRSLLQLHPHHADPALPVSGAGRAPSRPWVAGALLRPPSRRAVAARVRRARRHRARGVLRAFPAQPPHRPRLRGGAHPSRRPRGGVRARALL